MFSVPPALYVDTREMCLACQRGLYGAYGTSVMAANLRRPLFEWTSIWQWSRLLNAKILPQATLLNWYSVLDPRMLHDLRWTRTSHPNIVQAVPQRAEANEETPWLHWFITDLFPDLPCRQLPYIWLCSVPYARQLECHRAEADARALRDIVVALLDCDHLNQAVDGWTVETGV